MSASKVRVTLARSPNGEKKVHHATLTALGLGKIGTTRVHEDSPSFRGMIRKVAHLVILESAAADAPVGAQSRSRIRVGHGRATSRLIPGVKPVTEALAESQETVSALAQAEQAATVSAPDRATSVRSRKAAADPATETIPEADAVAEHEGRPARKPRPQAAAAAVAGSEEATPEATPAKTPRARSSKAKAAETQTGDEKGSDIQ